MRRRVRSRLLLLFLSLGVTGFAAFSLAQGPASNPDKATVDKGAASPAADRDSYDLVLLAPSHPVFIRLDVQVDGVGLKGVRFAYAGQLLKQHDKNGDGVLDKDEAAKMAPLVKSTSASETFSVSESWVSVDRDPADDQVTVAELADWIDRILGFPFSLAARPERATQSIDLFGLLDTNHDGRLSVAEQRAAEQTLAKLDLDEDEAFTIDELQPMLSQQARLNPIDASAPSADQPFLLLSDDASRKSAAEILQRRYAPTEKSASAKPGLSAATLGIDPAELARSDADQDGVLSQSELEQFLRNPAPHIELAAALLQKKPGRSMLEVVRDRIAPASSAGPRRGDRLTLTANALDIEWRLQANRAAVSDNRSFYQTQFRVADRDKNKYLGPEEFGALNLQNATFAQVDRDGDGMLMIEELLAYIDQEAASSQSRIEMTVSHNGKSVFEVIDADVNRRITRREWAQAVERLHAFDRDGDGAISVVELAGRFSVALALGKPVLFRNLNAPRGDGANTAPVVNRPAGGPAWFIKMDRNRDGDVSRREFLGPRETFKKLDVNGDGLISVEEAEKADAS